MRKFNIKNIGGHKLTTAIGVAIGLGSLVLVYLGKATYAEISAVILVVVPFLLYGKDEQNKTDI